VATEIDHLTYVLANRYAIERELGRGGTATVYLARDLKHERRVAIKVLHAEVRDSVGPERFLREISIAANLVHPNILPLLDSGRTDDFLFYVMPYVEGESLRDRLRREKQLRVEDAAQIAREMSDALDYAHRHNVIHRDIKPENILLEDGHAIVADFGIARAISAAGSDPLTAYGVVVGTPEYMSPEQAGGTGEMDARSDVYSLACVVYEMLAGQPPFTGVTAQSVMHQKLSLEAPRVTTRRPGVPGGIADTLHLALANDPADRIHTAAAFASALMRSIAPGGGGRRRTWTRGRVTAAAALATAAALMGGWWTTLELRTRALAIDAIAVLPITNRMADSKQYLVDAMQDAIIGELGQLHNLKRVVSRQSMLQYQNTLKTSPQIAKEQNVQALVEGSMFQDGDSVRVELKVIQAVPAERVLAAKSFDGSVRKVLSIQRDIARAIAGEIRVGLAPPEQARLTRAPVVEPAAYDEWARGWSAYRTLTKESIGKCIDHAVNAQAIDSTYAAAYALSAMCLGLLPFVAAVAPDDAFPRSLEASRRALERDEGLADAHFARAWALATYRMDWSGAEREYRRGLQLEPGSASGRTRFAWFLSWLGRDDEAVAEATRAIAENPTGPPENANLAAIHWVGRRYDDAITVARRAIEINPSYAFGYVRMGSACVEKGMFSDAVTAFETAVKLSDGAVNLRGLLGHAYARAGRRDDARRVLDELRALKARLYVDPLDLAEIHVALGETEQALSLIDEAFRVHAGDRILLKVNPVWDPLRPDPRFQALLRRGNFP
jgi:serine/threonine-protein kinase